jgi:D-glucosaminate-specific PTS system IID component
MEDMKINENVENTVGENTKNTVGENTETPAAEDRKKLNRKDINKLFHRWYMLCEVSNSFERLQSTAVCASYAPTLKKLYEGQPEAYKESLNRNLQFFNSEGIFGSVIHGTAIALEEEKSRNPELPGEMITSIKTGLMGPLAGIGDTIDWGTLRPILYGLAASFAMQGTAFGGLIPFLFTIITYLAGRYLCNFGYNFGRGSVKNLLESGIVKDVILGAGVLGMFMMGAIAANYVDISTPLKFTAGGSKFVVQDMLDNIVKGILPLAMVMGTYIYLKKKGNKIIRALLMIVAICLIGSLIGVL